LVEERQQLKTLKNPKVLLGRAARSMSLKKYLKKSIQNIFVREKAIDR